jgi:hypothetical protein
MHGFLFVHPVSGFELMRPLFRKMGWPLELMVLVCGSKETVIRDWRRSQSSTAWRQAAAKVR